MKVVYFCLWDGIKISDNRNLNYFLMAKVVVEKVNGVMNPIKIGKLEMKRLVEKLPD